MVQGRSATTKVSPLAALLLLAPMSLCAQRNMPKPAIDAHPPASPPVGASTAPVQQQGHPAAISDQTSQRPPSGDSKGSGALDLSYLIGPDDALQVTVFKEPSLSGEHIVRPDGMISVPLVGDLKAAGRTPMQLSTDITDELKKFVADPHVTVSVQAVNSKHIYLLGEIAHTGPMPLTAGMTPLQAISAAGGLSTFANAKKIYILRTVNAKQEKIPFNYKLALKTGDMQHVTLESGDTLVVP